MGTCPCASAPRPYDRFHQDADAWPYDTLPYLVTSLEYDAPALLSAKHPEMPGGSGLHHNAQKVQQVAASGDVDLPDGNEAETDFEQTLHDAPFTPRAAASVANATVSNMLRQAYPRAGAVKEEVLMTDSPVRDGDDLDDTDFGFLAPSEPSSFIVRAFGVGASTGRGLCSCAGQNSCLVEPAIATDLEPLELKSMDEGPVARLPSGIAPPLVKHFGWFSHAPSAQPRQLAATTSPICAVLVEEARADEAVDGEAEEDMTPANSVHYVSALSDMAEAERQASHLHGAVAKRQVPPRRISSDAGITATESELNRLVAKFVVITALLKGSFAYIARLEKLSTAKATPVLALTSLSDLPKSRTNNDGETDEDNLGIDDGLGWAHDDQQLSARTLSPVHIHAPSLSLSFADSDALLQEQFFAGRGCTVDHSFEDPFVCRAVSTRCGRGRSRSPRMVLDFSPITSDLHWGSPRGRQTAHTYTCRIPEDSGWREGGSICSSMPSSSTPATDDNCMELMTGVAADRGGVSSDLTDDLKINFQTIFDGAFEESGETIGGAFGSTMVPSLATPLRPVASAQGSSFDMSMVFGVDGSDGGGDPEGGECDTGMIGFNAADIAAGPARRLGGLRGERLHDGQCDVCGVPTLKSPTGSRAGRSFSPPAPQVRSGILHHKGGKVVAPTLSSPSNSGSEDER